MKFVDLIQEPRKKSSWCENRPLSAAKRWWGIRRRPVKIPGVTSFTLGCALLLALVAVQATTQAATITVTGTGDTIAVDGLVTLREAITSANNNANVNADVVAVGVYGTDTISFAIPGAGVHTITPASALPDITDPVTIDGYTQPGASENTVAVGDNAVLLIELNGTSAGSSGLTITGGGSTIRGLVINRFGSQFDDAGIFLRSDNNVIAGNFIGIDPAGSVELGNRSGVRVATGANNLIGGTTPAARNVISGNGSTTSSLGNVVVDKIFGSSDPAPSGTIIRGNYIGTNAAGTVAVHPQAFLNNMGVVVLFSTGTIIGGSDADDGAQDGNVGARNVISGNSDGIHTQPIGMTYAADLTVQGNFIGVDATGNTALGNFGAGIVFTPQGDGSDSITLGGTAAGAGNVISGNIGEGVSISNSNVVMQGNRIGTNLAGTLDLGNGNTGVVLTRGGSPPFPVVQFTVGGATPAARNIISGNGSFGLRVSNLSGSATVQGNYIGTQSDGVSPLGNDSDGIFAQEAEAGATIGGTGAGEGNVIAFNGGGIFGGAGITVPSAPGITILGNSIFSNGGLGIDLFGGGITPNDPNTSCDADTGPNNLQNFPVITSASSSGGSTTVQGSLNSTANTTFRIEFFSSAACDPSGNGEGQTFLGFTTVTTNGTCTANINATLPVAVAGGAVVTATATDPNGNTSEFSGCVQVTGGPTPTPTPTATPPRLLNISTRLRVLTDDNVLIGGFIISGTDPKKVILRAIGPSLGNFGVPDPLADPTLELHASDNSVVSNDNWKDTQQTEIAATGLAPTNDLESAIVATLDPGAYTAIVGGVGGGTGVGLVEAYDLDPAAGSLANISTRGFVNTGDNVMIGGFIVGSGDATVLVRAIGPSLTAFGVPGALQDPTLELHDGDGNTLTSNDDWKDTQQAEIEATGLAPSDDRESAILVTLPPGGYTAIVRGALDTTGVGLVEVYHLQ